MINTYVLNAPRHHSCTRTFVVNLRSSIGVNSLLYFVFCFVYLYKQVPVVAVVSKRELVA